MVNLFLKVLSFYKGAVSPYLGGRCRYYPSCSEYMGQAIREMGVLKGVYFGIKRLVRCAPGLGSGFDPVSSELSKLK